MVEGRKLSFYVLNVLGIKLTRVFYTDLIFDKNDLDTLSDKIEYFFKNIRLSSKNSSSKSPWEHIVIISLWWQHAWPWPFALCTTGGVASSMGWRSFRSRSGGTWTKKLFTSVNSSSSTTRKTVPERLSETKSKWNRGTEVTIRSWSRRPLSDIGCGGQKRFQTWWLMSDLKFGFLNVWFSTTSSHKKVRLIWILSG